MSFLARLPDIVDGPCPTCSFDRQREMIHHAVTSSTRLRLYGFCPECGHEAVWDAPVAMPAPVAAVPDVSYPYVPAYPMETFADVVW